MNATSVRVTTNDNELQRVVRVTSGITSDSEWLRVAQVTKSDSE